MHIQWQVHQNQFIFFRRDYFSSNLGTHQIKRKVQWYITYFLRSLCNDQFYPPGWCICYNWWAHADIITQFMNYMRVEFWCCVHSMIWRNVWHVFTTTVASRLVTLSWIFLLETGYFHYIHTFVFARISYNWNCIVYSFSNWLLLLSDMHLSFFYVFSQVYSSFLFNAE